MALQQNRYSNPNRDFFYEALVHSECDNSKLDGKRNAISAATSSSLKPYLDFLQNAIETEEKKADYQCNFKILKSNDSYKLEWLYPRYSIGKIQLVPKISFDISNIDLKETKNRIIFEDTDKMITFSMDDAILSRDKTQLLSIKNNPDWNEQITNLKKNESVTLNGCDIPFSLNAVSPKKGSTFSQGGCNYTIRNLLLEDNDNIIFEIDPQKRFLTVKEPIILDGQDFTIKAIIPKPEKLYFCNNKKEWGFQKEDDEYISEEKPQSENLMDDAGNLFRLRPYENSKRGKKRAILQLIDSEDVEDGEKSASDYFVENEMLQEIYQGNKKNTFKVQRIKADDRQLIVDKSNGQMEINPNLPIKMVIDTNNLKRQKRAIHTLLNTPVTQHRKLIQLFERKESVCWPQFVPCSINQWFVLTNEGYDGTESQRSFVRKGLGTDDFALLEGPPGSGKTTAILELILQFIEQGKRIMLTASTHVAIDNILDKVKKYPKVIPLRLGREGSIGESVKEFLIDNKINELMQNGWEKESAERFLLDSSNLVCGTTMGIQNHPDFRWKNDNRIVSPIYDVMIIDEASKTTFQEFIVPALYAKKWIIVGDIQQLAPYSETEYLKAHLTKSIDEVTQHLCTLTYLVNDLKNSRAKKHDFRNNEDNLYPLATELPEGCSAKDFESYANRDCFKDIPQNIAYTKKDRFFNLKTDKEISLVHLYSMDLLLLEAGSLNRMTNSIPESFNIVSIAGSSLKESFKRRQALIDGNNKNETRMVNQEDLKKFLSKDWANEVSWRLIRKFERRNLKESHYEKELAKLIPENDQKTQDALEDIEHIFFPSILELLQKGNKEHQKFETTLTIGFNQINRSSFENRFERIDYQHRMHPDISKFSRIHFYGAERGIAELKDGSEIDRSWDYHHYPTHAVWLDCKRDPKYDRTNNKQNRNYTEKEVILKELDSFVQWAKDPSNLPQLKVDKHEKWEVAILTYYRPQEAILREALQKYTDQANHFSHFQKDGIEIQLYTVDKYQGREADLIFLSTCRNSGVGFMDNTNRLNVALTRAKYQRVIVGDYEHFSRQHFSDELRMLAKESKKV